MGFSTWDVEIKPALERARRMAVVSASGKLAFYSNEWRRDVVRAEQSDKRSGMIYFTLKNGEFVEVENEL